MAAGVDDTATRQREARSVKDLRVYGKEGGLR
jgi:hypothetical protein